MRVTHTPQPPVARDHARPTAPGQARFSVNNTPAAAGNAPAEAATAASAAARQLPPGLDRVMARLESIPAESRNAGQANALERVSRNIARYLENHGGTPVAPTDGGAGGSGIAPPVTAAPPAEAPPLAAPVEPGAATPVATLPDMPAAPAGETPADTEVAAVVGEPVAAPDPAPEAPITAPVVAADVPPASVSEAPDAVVVAADAPLAAPILASDVAAGIAPVVGADVAPILATDAVAAVTAPLVEPSGIATEEPAAAVAVAGDDVPPPGSTIDIQV